MDSHARGRKESQHVAPAGKRQVAIVSILQTKRCYLRTAVMQRIDRAEELPRRGGNQAETKWKEGASHREDLGKEHFRLGARVK